MTTQATNQPEDMGSLRWRETLEALEDVAAGRVVDGELVHAWLKTWGTANEVTFDVFLDQANGSALHHSA